MKKHLSGKIIILDFFTYCCINCMHILPDLKALEEEFTYKDGLVVVGVHSAKFANEKNSKMILSAVQRHNISHPVVNDAKLSVWRDLGIVCWPSLVILGPRGQPLAVLVGEGHREELFLYAKVGLAYFKSSDQILDNPLPIELSRHLLPASSKNLLFPGKVAILWRKNREQIIVSDTGNNRILITNIDGKVEYVIGGYNPGFKDGSFVDARFDAPQGVCVLDDIIFVADNENHAIRKIDLVKKSVETLAGTGVQGHDYTGGKSGINQELSSPWDVAIYHREYDNGEKSVPLLLIAMAGTHQIWAYFLNDTVWWKSKVYKAGTCAAIVGNGREQNRNNSYPHSACLAQPSGLAVVQEMRSVFFADSESSAIRRVHLEDGKVSAVCGADRNPENLHCFGDTDGIQYTATLQHPLGITWNKFEKMLYVADTYNHKIKKVDPSGDCSTMYGSGTPSTLFTFDEPGGLAVSNDGNTLYVADTNNHAVKAINLKKNEITSISIILPEELQENPNYTYTFNTAINTDGGKLNILFDLVFKNDLKLNKEAPQKWKIIDLPNDWSVNTKSGRLSELIEIIASKGNGPKTVNIDLSLVVCTISECLIRNVNVVLSINQCSDAKNISEECLKIVIK
ncbi:NHL repeat-containing protein 2 isoform X2 [Prorops nasuta]